MTSTARFDVDALRARIGGAVLVPGEAGYDDARTVWNGTIDRRPAVIARCRTTADVAAAVDFGREKGLEIAVRGGAHGISGNAVCDDGLMIDLSPMRSVTVDPERRRAVVEPGVKLGELDAATQEHGLAVPVGTVSDTGVAGLALGGGMGYLTGLHGLTADNLVRAQVVLADSSTVEASVDEHPDLFWALRGGGGNFGVVTSFEFRLHPVGPEVQFALLFWHHDAGIAPVRACRDVVVRLPDQAGCFLVIGMNAPSAPFVPEEHHSAPGNALILVSFGTAEEHAQILAPLHRDVPPLFELVTPMPYTGVQQALDDGFPPGVRAYEKSLYLDELSDDALDVLADRGTGRTSPMSLSFLFPLIGAYTRVGEGDTAFGGPRRVQYVANIVGMSHDPAELATERSWVRDTWEALRPLAGMSGAYVNYMAEAEQDRIRASYGATKYERLTEIKGRYDPANLFHRNINIKPA
ncbi:FAD-binding oxidoreductase [Pseudonocardia lutea]|jgi:FAD/FMN-containing dehydrogenase|uniref:FAD-binding oxidoreductase n=2 Tax=Bacteria TaxID=2 RepID=A0ABW1I6L7_9PSEU